MVQSTPLKLTYRAVGSSAATLYLAQPTQTIYPFFWASLIGELNKHIEGLIDVVPAYCSLFIDCVDEKTLAKTIDYANHFTQQFKADEYNLLDNDQVTLDIPVCYHKSFAPDLDFVGKQQNLSSAQVIEYHTAPTYLVYALGFIPGFAFLGYVDDRIATPRRKTPRAEVAVGSVGIAGHQTGIYPAPSPGGWQIIGRTPMTLYAPDKEIFSVFNIASKVRFYEISLAAFHAWDEK